MKRIFAPILLLILTIAISGCSTNGGRMYIKDYPDSYGKNTYLSKPTVGLMSESEVGNNMYSEYYTYPHTSYTIRLLDDVDTVQTLSSITIKTKININFSKNTTGRLMTATGVPGDSNDTVFACYDANVDGSISTNPYFVCLLDFENDGVFDAIANEWRPESFAWVNNEPLDKKVRYEITRTTVDRFDENSFKKELLYQGVSKGVIRVSYREFKNDMARAAYTQDAQYDINEDGTALIAFKGLRIDVINASSSSIKYRVTKPFTGSHVKH